MNRSIHITQLYSHRFCCVYNFMVFDGKWIHGTYQGEEVFNVLDLVEDRNRLKLHGQ